MILTLFEQVDFTNTGWDALTNGSIIEVTETTFIGAMGSWFYVAIFIVMMVLMYARYQNFGALAFGTLLGAAIFTKLPDFVHPFIATIVALAIGLLLFSLFGKKGSQYG